MYAIIKTGGKQYKVAEGDVIKVEKLKADIGETVKFDDVKLIEKDGKAIVDEKQLGSVNVEGTILALEKGRKVVGVKFKRRKGYKRKFGHRQQQTRLQITKIHV